MPRVRIELPVEEVQPEPAKNSPLATARDYVLAKKDVVSSKWLLIGAFAVLVFVVLALISDRNRLAQRAAVKTAGTQTQPQDEALQLKQLVGQVYEVPDETPTVATVTDINKVKDQPFFVNAQNGDKVLLFSKTGRAILYRPSTKKIIEVAPINVGSGQAPTTDK